MIRKVSLFISPFKGVPCYLPVLDLIGMGLITFSSGEEGTNPIITTETWICKL